MKSIKIKVVSVLITVALLATVVFGALSLSAGTYNTEYFGMNNGTTEIDVYDGMTTYTVSTVFGSKTVTADRILYVSPDGSGSGTEDDPASLTSVLSGSSALVQEGDVVIIKDGEYALTSTLTISKSGTYDKPITIMAENTGEAIISFYGQSYGSAGISIDADFVNLIGIKQCGAGANGIRVRGNYNLVENCESYDNRNTGIQITRTSGSTIDDWPGYNLIKNCTSHNNYDYRGNGEDADGFAAKLTLGYGNVFDGCIAYRNSDDGWDLYARHSSGNIGAVYIYNSVAFENGYLEYTQEECLARYTEDNSAYLIEGAEQSYRTADGDGNGFKLGGEAMEGDVFVYNCLSFANKMHGFTDNSNPGFMSVRYCTAVDNSADIDDDPDSVNHGKVVSGISATQSNFDLARSDASYNHMDHNLSIKTDIRDGLDMDYIKGSVQDSILFTNQGGSSGSEDLNIIIEGSMDADVRNSITGVEMDGLLSADDVFVKIATTLNSVTGEYTHNITGHEGRESGYEGQSDINDALRNADGSINMGDYFKIKDQSILLGENNPIGSDLTKESYDEYTHFYMSDFTEFESEVQVILQSAKDILYVQTDENAVYQDFEAVGKIFGCVVMWESSDSSILEVSKTYVTSVSESEYIPIIVNRPDEDTEVTLTATIWYYGYSIQKEFVLNVKAKSPKIGDITVIGPDGNELTNGESIIVDKYTALSDPQVIVLNAADYSGKAITEDEAEFNFTYEFGEDIAALNSGDSTIVSGFTTAQDGAFKITIDITIIVGENAGESVEFVYYVLVASNTANVDFLNGERTVVVNSQGYNISGDLTSAIGTIYSYASSTQLTDITAEEVMANGDSLSFRTTRISFDFANDNLGEYYIYTLFTNGNGEITSGIYEDKINVVLISDNDAFYTLAQYPMNISDEEAASTVYALTTDLDFTDYAYEMYNPSGYDPLTMGFKGFFNGNGYTISNITIASTGIQYTGVFRSLGGGTVTNVKFNNINVSGEQEKIGGIFGTIYYGNVYNIEITNITVLVTGSAQAARVGGLSGAITSDNMPVYIDHISIVNDVSPNADGTYTAQIGGAMASQRVGGLVGYIQTGSADRHMDVHISNVYTKVIVYGGSSVGGIAGNYDDRNELDYLEITNCYTESVLNTTSAILGGYRGTGSHSITNCAGVIIRSTNGSVTYYSSNSDVTINADTIKDINTWLALGFDLENVWQFDEVNGGITLRSISG